MEETAARRELEVTLEALAFGKGALLARHLPCAWHCVTVCSTPILRVYGD